MIKEFALLKAFKGQIDHGILMGIPDGAMTANQVHGDTILKINHPFTDHPDCDGFMTNVPHLQLMVKVADCQGVLMYDPVTHSAAAIHSGWRGSTLNIIGKAVRQMHETYGAKPTDLRVAISPSLGPCCAQFTDPKKELPAFCHPYIEAGNHVNFWKLSLKQLADEGILKEHIELAAECTKSTPGYFSNRNGDSGRMGVFIKLRVV